MRRRPPRRVTLALGSAAPVLCLVALVACGLASVASAQEGVRAERSPEVTLNASSLFVSESMGMVGTTSLGVTLTNHTARDLRGELLVAPVGWRERDVPQRYHVDLAAHQSRVVPVVIRLTHAVDRLVLTYRPEGLGEQRAELPLVLRGNRAAVVLADPPRMRNHLFAMTTGTGSSVGSGLVVAEVAFDPESGDPRVPEEAAGWSTTPIVFATVSDAEKLEGARRRAFIGHVQAGARVVLVPRRPEDCVSPIVRELMGDVRCVPLDAEPSTAASPVPEWQRALRLRVEGDAGAVDEPFGMSRPLGFGAVFLLGWDANAADADPTATQRVLQSVELHLARPAGASQALGDAPEDIAALRSALDPNESFRPALGIVALLLLLYVFLVGPINFHVVAQRGRPTLALLSTPLISLLCLLVMAGAAYVSKGVWMRYRVIEVVELPSGDTRGIQTRYVGYYLTRPSTFDVTPPDGARVSLLERGGGGRGPIGVPLSEGLGLTEVRGGLWETVVTQEQRLVNTAEAVRAEIRYDNAAQVVVFNHGTDALRGAIYMGPTGEVFALGDLAPGESRTVPTRPLTTLSEWQLRTQRGSSSELAQVAEAMGMPADASLALRGALSAMSGGASREGVWARLEGAGGGPSASGFERDSARRFVFIVSDRERALPTPIPGPGPPGTDAGEFETATPDPFAPDPLAPDPFAPVPVTTTPLEAVEEVP